MLLEERFNIYAFVKGRVAAGAAAAAAWGLLELTWKSLATH